ncbi:hypothetical protein [Halalkalibaculum sp. DA384]|uniref:hypothetical protein n=1 Tax=Halalkalibaculum sp. DA384 TaxID=3373606 RepID=UPI0037551DD9
MEETEDQSSCPPSPRRNSMMKKQLFMYGMSDHKVPLEEEGFREIDHALII